LESGRSIYRAQRSLHTILSMHLIMALGDTTLATHSQCQVVHTIILIELYGQHYMNYDDMPGGAAMNTISL